MADGARRRRPGVVAAVLGAVTGLVMASIMGAPPRWERAQLAWWEYDASMPSVMTVAVCGGPGDSGAVRVSETSETVVLRASTKAPCYDCVRPMIQVVIPVEAIMSTPLNGRQVVTAGGAVLPRHQPGDLYFSCFD